MNGPLGLVEELIVDDHGKPLTKCKYGFPYSTPEPCKRLDDDHVRYLDMRRLSEDAFTVQYSPEIDILWGAHHNVQHVSKHGFEQYLAKYISKTDIGDDQEKYYEQKFLLTVPDQSEVVLNPPTSWIEHCVQLDTHLDAISCMQSQWRI